MERRVISLIAILLVNISLTYGQKNIENLVFEGAGIRGIAYAGAFESLERHGVLDSLKRVAGTSAGALTSLLISLGYSASEIVEITSEMRFEELNDGQYLFIGGLIRTKNNFGWYRDEELTNWIGSLIQAKTGDSEITFRELHEKGFLELFVTATSLSKQKLVILSHETYPDMKVKNAVRISMSIPLYFEAVFVDEDGAIYESQNDSVSLEVMVDGGITGNFPIHIFDSTIVDQNDKVKRVYNPKTIGIRMETEDQLKEDKSDRELAEVKIENFEDYATAFYTYVLESLNRKDLTEEDWQRTISVSCKGIGPKVKKLSPKQVKTLIASGRSAVNQYFSEHD
ncbi:patatin-like phospholipase family protein [Halocola ammonii]